MRILVTGASGFVGKVFCATAIAHGHSVRQVVRTQPADGLSECFVGDLATTQDWSAAFAGIDVVVHLAARVHQMREDRKHAAAAYHSVNVDATRRLVQQAAAAGVRRFVFISSIKVNGESSGGQAFIEESRPGPLDLYGSSKWLAETALQEFAESHGMEWVVLRPPLVYGANVGGNFRKLLRLVDHGWPLPLGRVQARRSYVNVWNFAELILLCCDRPAAANQLFLAEDLTLSTPELVHRIAVAMGKRSALLPFPLWILRCCEVLPVLGPAFRRLIGTLEVSSSKARRLLGWNPSVSAEEALQRTVEYYLTHHKG
ncbi:SDR family oxidoreductase [Uliginosibacterium flavum]|uniref:NAD-dependent epimerase/dehydratase family protein n=1 Tax=Uliginosibacterium flavum TaxID=1396831 RepID=A0ABV2TGV7_9RHOO